MEICLIGCMCWGEQVHDLDGKNYRLFKENLDKEIVPQESKIVVKRDQVKIQLRKVRMDQCCTTIIQGHASSEPTYV